MFAHSWPNDEFIKIYEAKTEGKKSIGRTRIVFSKKRTSIMRLRSGYVSWGMEEFTPIRAWLLHRMMMIINKFALQIVRHQFRSTLWDWYFIILDTLGSLQKAILNAENLLSLTSQFIVLSTPILCQLYFTSPNFLYSKWV